MANVTIISCLCMLSSCGQTNVSERETEASDVVAAAQEKAIDLKIGEISIVEDSDRYLAWTHITNNGDTTANNYSVVIEWTCPTETSNVHNTPMPTQALKPIRPGETVSISFYVPLSCQPRPIVIPCIFHLINMGSIKESDTTNNQKRLDYTLAR